MTIADLEEITVGMVYDIIIESSNDSYQYAELATQEDIDAF